MWQFLLILIDLLTLFIFSFLLTKTWFNKHIILYILLTNNLGTYLPLKTNHNVNNNNKKGVENKAKTVIFVLNVLIIVDMPHNQHPHYWTGSHIRWPYIWEIINHKMVKKVENVTKDRINPTHSENITKSCIEKCDTKVREIDQVWDREDFGWE